jgi:hypothetical protein
LVFTLLAGFTKFMPVTLKVVGNGLIAFVVVAPLFEVTEVTS